VRAEGLLLVLVLALASLVVPRAAWAQARAREPLVFVADPRLGVEPSVRTLESIRRVTFRYEEALPPIHVADGAVGRVGRYLVRLVRLLFLDEPLAELASTVPHEVGGHGARGRELGLRPTYQFALPGIYRPLFSATVEQPSAAYTSYETAGIVEGTRAIAGVLGGLEANYVGAWWINARIVRAGGDVSADDLLVYATSKLPYVTTFLSTSIDRRGAPSSDDVASYVSSLQDQFNGWRAEDRRRIAGRLRAGYLWNLADPTLLWSFWGTAASTLVLGERTSRMPLPHVGGFAVLLSPRFGLTPFGAEQLLDVFASDRRGRMIDVYGRVGTSGLASYYGAGARALGLRALERVTAGAELDVWRQPELLLDERGVFDPPERVGVNAALYGDVELVRGLAVTGKLGAKTSGYVAGLPLAGGPHGYVGVSVGW
jgi:hypothetical protein